MYGNPTVRRNGGFSLVELMIGMAISLIAVLAMSQIFLDAEGQRRTTGSGSEAQSAAAVGLYTMERDIAMAGYAINHSGFQSCQAGRSHDGGSLGSLFPVRIEDGGTNPDTLVVTYGDTLTSGIPTSASMPTLTSDIVLNNPAGCTKTGYVVISAGGACSEIKITDIKNTNVIEHDPAPAGTPSSGTAICLSNGIVQHKYEVSGDRLMLTTGSGGTPSSLVAGAVFLKAQYGISNDANSDEVTSWVSATGPWANPTAANQAKIKAVRVAIVVRATQPEKEVVSAACPSADGTPNRGPCLWEGTPPAIDLSATNTDWAKYRYKVFSTIAVPRNLMWKPS